MNIKLYKLKRFWHELSRRKVFKGIAYYGASTLLILEAAEIICDAIGVERVPVWLLWILGAGFLLSLCFSWIFDITPGGITKTKALKEEVLPFRGKELKTYKISTFISVGIIICLLSFNLVDGIKSRQMEDLEKSIAVLPCTGILPPGYEAMVFEFVGDQIAEGLNKIDTLDILPWNRTKKYLKENKSYAKMGRELGASLLIDWQAWTIDSINLLSLKMINASDEKVIWSNEYSMSRWSEVAVIKPEISKDIARRLKTFLSLEEREKINKTPNSDVAAYLAWKANITAQNAMQLYEMGIRHTDLSAFDEACNFYTMAIELDSAFAEAYANRAKTISWGIYTTYYDDSYLNRCREDIRKASELDKNLPEAIVALGFYYYYGLKDYRNALIHFERASESEPDNADILFYLTLIQRRLGHWDSVISLSEKVLKSRSVSSLYLTNIGLSYDYLHDFSKAIECHDRAILINPDWEAPYKNKAESILLLSGDVAVARNILLKTKNLNNNRYYKNIAQLDVYESKIDSAFVNIERAFPEGMEIQGNNLLMKAKIYNLAGLKMQSQEYYKKAIEFYQDKILYDPEDSDAYSKLGIAYAARGLTDEAIENGEKAVRLTSVQDDALLGPDRLIDLARIYALTGKYDLCVGLIGRLSEMKSIFSVHIVLLDPDFSWISSSPQFKDITAKNEFLNNQ
ncbi:MAG: tetratricopeptide repeat protein [Marinilabiliaceae bacterium]|jgi:tetratricopeptide (TPR) repeat protein|nr:tetratricopeptide repeat protein [Marinilabiliaceae bacterium]